MFLYPISYITFGNKEAINRIIYNWWTLTDDKSKQKVAQHKYVFLEVIEKPIPYDKTQ